MSLKAFHIFFILICTVLSAVMGIWAVRQYTDSGEWGDLAMAVLSFAGGIVLLIYGRWFLRKLRNVSFI